MRIGILCSFLALSTLFSGTNVVASDDDITNQIETTSAKVHENLEKFQQKGNCQVLFEVDQLIVKLGNQWQKDPTRIRPEVLRLSLALLEMCFISRDKAYDIKNHPPFTINVSPGLGPGLWAGMAPRDVKDPEIRKKYEEAIAENKQRETKLAREKRLQEFIDSGISNIRGHLNLSRELGTIRQDATLIKNTIKDPALLKRIKEEVFTGLQDENGVPLDKLID